MHPIRCFAGIKLGGGNSREKKGGWEFDDQGCLGGKKGNAELKRPQAPATYILLPKVLRYTADIKEFLRYSNLSRSIGD